MDNIIIVHLFAGLGNQIFQYAAGFLQQKITNGKLFFMYTHGNSHDTRDYRNIFNLPKYDDELPQNIIYYHQQDSFEPWNPQDYINKNIIFEAYYQNYPTLKPILPEFKQIILDKLKTQRESILLKYNILPSSGFIHIRRGDYLDVQHIHHIQTIDYYTKAVEKLSHIKNWFIFSDDIEYVKNQPFFQNLNPTFVDESDPIMTLALMSEIRDGAIIANSTFSWWGAYLGTGEENVIYPLWWMHNNTPNLFPEKWIGIR